MHVLVAAGCTGWQLTFHNDWRFVPQSALLLLTIGVTDHTGLLNAQLVQHTHHLLHNRINWQHRPQPHGYTWALHHNNRVAQCHNLQQARVERPQIGRLKNKVVCGADIRHALCVNAIIAGAKMQRPWS